MPFIPNQLSCQCYKTAVVCFLSFSKHSGERSSIAKKFSTLPATFRRSTSAPPSVNVATATDQDISVRSLKYGPNHKVLRLLTWNIQGLDDDLVIERAMAVCDEIVGKGADIVYLQEIVPNTWDAITKRLQDRYYFYRDEAPHRYFHILMVRIDSDIVVEGDAQVMKFPNTTQSRLLLHLPVTFHEHELHLLTSHLESLSKNAAERKNQLSTVYSLMSSLTESQGKICIFGGDMNITGREVEQIGFPENFGDIWEMCGSDISKRCTWDSTEPRMRLDRIVMCPKDSPLQPDTFDLVGESLLDNYGVYPSDHLGVWTEFVLRDESTSSKDARERKYAVEKEGTVSSGKETSSLDVQHLQ